MSKFKNIGSWSTLTKASSQAATLEPHEGTSPNGHKLVEGELRRIRQGQKQYRSHTEEEHILQLMASIREHGFTGSLPVIKVTDDDNYDYEYLGGHTTGEALIRLGYEKVLLSVEDVKDSLALAEFSYQLNGANRPLNAVDDTLAILDILSEALSAQVGEIDADEIPVLIRQIARDTEKVDLEKINCIKETWERNRFALSIKSFAASRLPLLHLPEDLKIAVKRGLSPVSALEVNKIDTTVTREELIDKAMNMSVAGVKQAVKEANKVASPPLTDQAWEPLQTFRSVTTRATKIDFSTVPLTKRSRLAKALERVERILEEIES